MKAYLKAVAAMATGIAMLCAANTASAQEEVVIAGWSGGYDKLFENDLLGDFLKENNIRIRWVLGGSSLENVSKIKASRNTPEIDLALIDDLPQRAAMREGLWDSMTPEEVPNLGKVVDLARMPEDRGVSFGINLSGLIYQPKVFEEKGLPLPTSWNDLFREDLKGRVVLFPLTQGEGIMTLLALAKLGGGDQYNIEPGFDLAKKAADNVLEFYSNAALVSTLFEREEGWLSVNPMDYAELIKSRGAPIEFVMPDEGVPARTYTVSLVAGAPHRETALKVINALLSEDVQAKMVSAMSLAPVNPEAEMPEHIKKMAQKVYPVDLDDLNKNRQAWIDRWNREIQSR